MRVAERVLDPGGGVEDALPGELVSLSTVETTRIGEGVGAFVLGAGAAVGTLVGAGVLLATSVPIGLTVVIGVPVVMLAVQALSAPLVARADAHQAAVGSAAGVAADLLGGLRVLKGLGATRAGTAAYRRVSGVARTAALDANRMRSAYTGITFTVASGFLVVVAWIGGHQALDGQITVGELVAALGLTQFLLGPLGRLALTIEVLAQARASSARLAAALDAPRTVGPLGPAGPASSLGPAGSPVPPGRSGAGGVRPAGGARLVVEGVSHGGLDGLSLEVAEGELVGVVASPAEAAELVTCLERSADPAGGSIVVDGVDLASLDLTAARRTVLVAHQNAPLFEETLAAEVASAAAADGHRVIAALAAAAADDIADELAGPGSEAERGLGEAGRGLSGGQRQRVALARALATDAPVLVLHEPTTAVDAATEHRIAAGLRALRAGRTTLVITASPTLLAAADRVVLLQDGRVVATGDHAGLAADSRYREAVLG
jgi:putative ABC transport system ATP-binding protein